MKKSLLIAFTLILCMKAFAQVTSNVILFTENGERFYAILNGTRMNADPVTNLKVEQLNQPNYALKVIFENKTLGEMNKTLYVESGVEAVYAVKLDNKGKFKLAFKSSVPIAQAAPIAPQQQVVYWGVAPVATTTVEQTTTTTTTNHGNTGNVTGTTNHGNTGNVTGTTNTGTGDNVNINMNVNGTGTGTNVTTGTGESMSMNVNTDGFGMNVNINATGTGTTTGVTNSQSTVTTTTTTTTSQPTTVVTNPKPTNTIAACYPMSSMDFDKATASIKAKTFEDSKFTLAKQVASNNCLTAEQIKKMMGLFDFEQTKLDFAKFAYDRCYDRNNYYLVNDAFEFEASIDDLDAYIKTR